MTVCAGCSPTLRMLPRRAVAIHLYSWCWHAVFGYLTWSPSTYPQHLYMQHFNAQYVLTPHLCTHTHHFYTPHLYTPFFHQQRFYTDSFTHLTSTRISCTHRSSTISFLFPAFPIPLSPFFGHLLEEIDIWGFLVLYIIFILWILWIPHCNHQPVPKNDSICHYQEQLNHIPTQQTTIAWDAGDIQHQLDPAVLFAPVRLQRFRRKGP